MTAPSRTPGPIARAINEGRFDRYRNARSRRRLSVAHVGLSSVIVALLASALAFDAVAGLVAACVTMLVWFPVTGLLNASVNGLTEVADRDLDELQRRIRDQAYRQAYRLLGVLVVGLVVLLTVTVRAPLDEALLLPLGVAAVFLVFGLPVHLLAWTLPDEPPES